MKDGLKNRETEEIVEAKVDENVKQYKLGSQQQELNNEALWK